MCMVQIYEGKGNPHDRFAYVGGAKAMVNFLCKEVLGVNPADLLENFYEGSCSLCAWCKFKKAREIHTIASLV